MRTRSLSFGVAALTMLIIDHRDLSAPPQNSRLYARISVSCPRNSGIIRGAPRVRLEMTLG